jgi:hypothetical protein
VPILLGDIDVFPISGFMSGEVHINTEAHWTAIPTHAILNTDNGIQTFANVTCLNVEGIGIGVFTICNVDDTVLAEVNVINLSVNTPS